MKQLFYLLLSITTISSCNISSKKEDFPKTLTLTGERWFIGDSLGKAFSIEMVGNKLLVHDEHTKTLFTAIDLKKPYQAYHFGTRGGGPDELMNPGAVIAEQNAFKVFDFGKMSFLKYDLDSIVAKKTNPKKLFQIEESYILSAIEIPPYYIASGFFPDKKRLLVLDAGGENVATTGNYPVNEETYTNTPSQVLGLAYQSQICKEPNGNRFALATRYGGIIQFFEWNAAQKQAEEIHRVEYFSPEFATENIGGTPNFLPTKKTRWGYLSVTATDKYVFALYSGKIQSPENAFYAGNIVHIYDWEGKPISMLQLDYNVTSITIKENILYALIDDKKIGNDVVMYNLRDL